MKLSHGRVEITLHGLKEGSGTPLLLLHELGSSAAAWPDAWMQWPGPVHALDFAGHGTSQPVKGGGYYAEHYLADADLALEAVGDTAAVTGAGIGAYVALLLAGSRPARVPAALLLPGRGLAGGGSEPDFDQPLDDLDTWLQRQEEAARHYAPGTDPRVYRCERDLRPVAYITAFAEASPRLLFSEGGEGAGKTPAWWKAARRAASQTTVCDGLDAGLRELDAHSNPAP